MPETCENWLGLVNSCIYNVHQGLLSKFHSISFPGFKNFGNSDHLLNIMFKFDMWHHP